jgi:hypothetical protein
VSHQVEDEAASLPSHWVLVKGAPEVVQAFLGQVPPTYAAAYKEYAAQGGRHVPRAPVKPFAPPQSQWIFDALSTQCPL